MDDELEDDGIPTARLQWVDLPLLAFGALGDLAGAVQNTCNNITRTLALHSNYRTFQTEFADQVRAELEALPVTDDDDASPAS